MADWLVQTMSSLESTVEKKKGMGELDTSQVAWCDYSVVWSIPLMVEIGVG